MMQRGVILYSYVVIVYVPHVRPALRCNFASVCANEILVYVCVGRRPVQLLLAGCGFSPIHSLVIPCPSRSTSHPLRLLGDKLAFTFTIPLPL